MPTMPTPTAKPMPTARHVEQRHAKATKFDHLTQTRGHDITPRPGSVGLAETCGRARATTVASRHPSLVAPTRDCPHVHTPDQGTQGGRGRVETGKQR